jgi:hypothetical protein
MCKFYSAIVLKNGDLLHNENLTSHEDIIRLFNINDNQINCENHVKVEFAPDDITDSADIEKYKLTVDEESTPEWFEKHREYVISRLKDIVSKRIITSDQKLLTGGLYAVKNCKIDKVLCAQIIYMQASTINEMWKNSTINEMWGNSTVNAMTDNSTVNEMWDNSTVNTMRDNSTINEMRDNSTINTMRDNSTINEMRDNSTVNAMRENSTINEMWDNSTVNEMWKNSTINEMRDNSTVKLNNSINKLSK